MLYKPFDFIDEVWAPITGDIVNNIQENKYIVSNHGYISNINYHTHHMVYSPKYCGQFNNRAYINLTDKFGNGLMCVISRIVAKCFCPGFEPGLEVNHIDGNPKYDYYKNLEWCTRSANIRHAYDNDLIHSTIDESMARSICHYLEEDKLSAEEISIRTGLCNISNNPIALISAIKKGKLWAHISKEYNIPLGRHGRVFSDAQIHEICKLIQTTPGISTKDILNNLNITYNDSDIIKYRNTISAIRNRRKYTYISEKYSF